MKTGGIEIRYACLHLKPFPRWRGMFYTVQLITTFKIPTVFSHDMESRFRQTVSAFEEGCWWYMYLSKAVIMFPVCLFFSQGTHQEFQPAYAQTELLWGSQHGNLGQPWCEVRSKLLGILCALKLVSCSISPKIWWHCSEEEGRGVSQPPGFNGFFLLPLSTDPWLLILPTIDLSTILHSDRCHDSFLLLYR